jgi:hypothetical protein
LFQKSVYIYIYILVLFNSVALFPFPFYSYSAERKINFLKDGFGKVWKNSYGKVGISFVVLFLAFYVSKKGIDKFKEFKKKRKKDNLSLEVEASERCDSDSPDINIKFPYYSENQGENKYINQQNNMKIEQKENEIKKKPLEKLLESSVSSNK